MIQDWPEDLNKFERQGWQALPLEARRKRQADQGVPRWRRRFSNAGRKVTLSIIVTRDERAVFDRFFHEDCAEGAHLFRMPDPTTQGWAMLDDSGAPLVSDQEAPLQLGAVWLCSWSDELPTQAIVEQVKFRVTFSVVVMP